MSDPIDTYENPAGPPDSWVPIGLGIGMVKGPEVPGDYRLVLEPVDEEFRQGDSWMINSRVSFDDSFRSFRVGGGMYLDENLQPFTDVILVGTSRDIFVKLDHQGSENTLQADLAFVANGGVQSSVPVSLERVGTTRSGDSTYLGEVRIETPAAASEKSAGDGPTIEEIGSLTTTVAQDVVVTQFASEVWVEVEQILDKDGNDTTNNIIDIKQMAPLEIRYRVNGTEQHISHSLTVIEFTADEQSDVHSDFYGGPPAAIVSDVIDQNPETIVTGYYGTDWDGRDNSGDARILLEGQYHANLEVALDQFAASDNARTRNPVIVRIGKPNSSNYGPTYNLGAFPEPHFYDTEIDIARFFQQALGDGTSFESLGIAEATHPHASEAIDRLAHYDALFSFVGHTDGRGSEHGGYGYGQIGFWNAGASGGTCANASQIAASRNSLQAFPLIDTSYIEDLGSNDLGDVMLAILAGCYTDYPASPSPDNLPISLLQKGVDITLGFGSNPSQDHSTKWLLLQTWINSFWPYASGANEVAGEKLNLQEALEFAKAQALLDGQALWTPEDLEVFSELFFHHTAGAAPSDNLWPARYGNFAE